MPFYRLATSLALVLISVSTAHADLDIYLNNLNVGAETNLGSFRTRIGAHFAASGTELDIVFRSVDKPAHAELCFWLARHSGQPVEVVMRKYRHRKGQGWGALAKSLGIKPGSSAFKTLKQGNLGWKGPTGRADGGNKGKNKARGRGNGKGRS